MTHTEELARRWSAVMMGNYRTPPVALAHGARRDASGTSTAASTSTCSAASRRRSSATRTPKVVEAITAAGRDARARLQPGHARARRARWPSGCWSWPAGPGGSSSATPAPRPTRRRSRSAGSPAGPRWSPRSGPSTAGRWARSRSPASPARPTRSRRCPAASGTCPTATPDALADASPSATAMVLLEPMLGEGGVLPAPAGYLAAAAARPPRRRRAVRPRRGADRHRPHRALVRPPGRRASAPTSSPWPRRSAAGCRSARPLAFGDAAELLGAGSHGSTFGGNPIAAAAALAVLDTIRDEGLLERAKELEHRFTAGIEGLGHPRRQRGPRARCAARRRPDRRRRPAGSRPGCAPPGS